MFRNACGQLESVAAAGWEKQMNAMSEVAKCQLCELEGTLECGYCRPSPFQGACAVMIAVLLWPVFLYLLGVATCIDWLSGVNR